MIGVLALQGGFRAHLEKLRALNCEALPIRNAEELKNCSGLIIPGGESTVMNSLLDRSFISSLRSFAKTKPLFGTCAGLIILAKLGMIEIAVKRNAYGRQSASFLAELEIELDEKRYTTEGLFIRAPKIVGVLGKEVLVHSTYQGERVFVSQKNIFCATFHPELTKSQTIHNFFIRKCHEKDSC